MLQSPESVGLMSLRRTSNNDDKDQSSPLGIAVMRQWTSKEDMRVVSPLADKSPVLNRSSPIIFGSFTSPYSKSVPRRKKSLIRYRTNRSLNFDASLVKDGNFKSPRSTNVHGASTEKFLSRSAKIMQALNNGCDSRGNRVSKSLNFDATPSPKKDCHVWMASSPKADDQQQRQPNTPSTFDSPLSNDESITTPNFTDENQNKTPSQSNKKIVKKSLNFSPMLHANFKKVKRPCFGFKSGARREDEPAQVPENGEEDENEGPSTPKNKVRPYPESMSAIKASHKKERLSRQLEKSACKNKSLTAEEGVSPLQNAFLSPFSMKLGNSFQRDEELQGSLMTDSLCYSEDDMSETGSLFQYSMEQDDKETTKKKDAAIVVDSAPESLNSSLEESRASCSNSGAAGPSTPENPSKFLRDNVATDSIKKSHRKVKEHKRRLTGITQLRLDSGESSSPSTQSPSKRPATPENVSSSRLLMPQFSSVKKSHKKDKHKSMMTRFLSRKQHYTRRMDESSGDEFEDFQKLSSSSLNSSDASKFNDSGNANNNPVDMSPKKS